MKVRALGQMPHVAPLRRKSRGSITPKIRWLHYAGNGLAPLRRKRNGSITPKTHIRGMSTVAMNLAALTPRTFWPTNSPVILTRNNESLPSGRPCASPPSLTDLPVAKWPLVISEVCPAV